MKKFTMWMLIAVLSQGAAMAQWRQLPGKALHGAYCLYVDDTIMVAGTQDSSIMRSRDRGMHWESSHSGMKGRLLPFEVKPIGGTFVVGTDSGAFISNDVGLTWRHAGIPFSQTWVVSAADGVPGVLLLAADSGVFRSTDDGVTWQRVYAAHDRVHGAFSLSVGSRGAFAGTNGRGVLRSEDQGLTWSYDSLGLPIGWIRSVFQDQQRLFACVSPGSLYVSLANGTRWSVTGGDLEGADHTRSWINVKGALFIGTDRAVNRSIDGGATWTDVSDSLPPFTTPVSFSLNRDTLYICALGAWIGARPLSELLLPSSVEDVTIGASATRLGLSIPNPASSEVAIPYTLGKSGHVTLTLYDALLREVVSAVNEEQESGVHSARVDVTGLANGVYYYRLAANGRVLARQMVIVR